MQTDPEDYTPKARRTRASLLQAGRKLAGQHGVAGVNVMAICAEAGVGRTSFYNYFEDASSLVEAVAEEAAWDIKARFDLAHSGLARGRERLGACLRMILTLSVKNPEIVMLLTSLAHSSPRVGDLLSAEIHAELSAATDPHIPDVAGLTEFLTITTLALARQFAEGKLAPGSVDQQLDILWRSVG